MLSLEINGDLASLLYTQKEKAVNVIKFSARALKILSGKLTVEASYSVTSKTVGLLSAVDYPDFWLEIIVVSLSCC